MVTHIPINALKLATNLGIHLIQFECFVAGIFQQKSLSMCFVVLAPWSPFVPAHPFRHDVAVSSSSILTILLSCWNSSFFSPSAFISQLTLVHLGSDEIVNVPSIVEKERNHQQVQEWRAITPTVWEHFSNFSTSLNRYEPIKCDCPNHSKIVVQCLQNLLTLVCSVARVERKSCTFNSSYSTACANGDSSSYRPVSVDFFPWSRYRLKILAQDTQPLRVLTYT